ncbi:MAG: sigma-70 family RNA polymerase sigma factor [Phycisphaerales bacterium]|nr:MAG: sigma-70 family RNA polymerase sigma factor [Phycisphaerales bacterium]
MTESLLQRIARGDADAVKDCIDRYADLVWSIALRLTPSRAEAEDAVQDVFIDLWRSAERFDPSVASEPTFIVMIARRRLIDRLRRRSRRIQPSELGDIDPQNSDETPDRAAISEDAAIAAKALDELSKDQQTVLRLSIHHGCSHSQIAEITGMPLGTVKTNIRRGLIRVREILESSRSTTEAAS